MKKFLLLSAALLCLLSLPSRSQGWFRQPTPNDTLRSTRILPDGSVLFSIYAPKASEVGISGDLPWGVPIVFDKSDNGVWSAKVKGLGAGVYRYHFTVDGVSVYDPKAPLAGESTAILRIEPTGEEYFAMKDVPHGAIAQRYYNSKATGTVRRLHVWTPAGYEKSCDTLPVFYLVHGGGDTDNSWVGPGAAGNILDNLLAEGKIVPMVVVMPNGSIETTDMAGEVPIFVEDLTGSIVPFIEENYRVRTDPAHKALGGLSMGGWETLDTMLDHYEEFDYFLVFSSGWFPAQKEAFEAYGQKVKSIAPALNRTLKLLLFTQGGPEDIAYNNCKAMLSDIFDKYGVKYEYSEAPGGHTWLTWRRNLYEYAPRLFK